jgi:hypothetical protein
MVEGRSIEIIDAKGFCIVWYLLDPKVFGFRIFGSKGFSVLDLGSKRFSYLWYPKGFRIFLWHPMSQVSVALDFWRDDQSPPIPLYRTLSSYDTPKRWKAALAAFSDIIYET